MKIGYSLINGNHNEVQYWGGTPGVEPGMPSRIVLPNGSIAEGVSALGPLMDWQLVERHWQLGTSAGIAWDGSRVVVTAVVTPEMVQAERVRRLSMGFAYQFPDARGTVQIGTTPEDMHGWDAVSKLASALIALGQGEQTITIVPQSSPVEVTAVEWQSILLAAAQFQQPIWAGSFALQAMSPIPVDYATNDSYWQAI